ncbi:MAG: hypothetical protein JNK60_22695 [Acidobacteria bacterium]|nr:hypothetical protein [Acidobacteriota bacterium]
MRGRRIARPLARLATVPVSSPAREMTPTMRPLPRRVATTAGQLRTANRISIEQSAAQRSAMPAHSCLTSRRARTRKTRNANVAKSERVAWSRINAIVFLTPLSVTVTR